MADGPDDDVIVTIEDYKEYWEECQVQQKKNSRSYKRTLNYLFLQVEYFQLILISCYEYSFLYPF